MRYWILTADYKSTMKNYLDKKSKKAEKSIKRLCKRKDILYLSDLEIYNKQEYTLFAELLSIKNKHCSNSDIELIESMDLEKFIDQINSVDRYPWYLPASDFIVKEGNKEDAMLKYTLFKVLYRLLMTYLASSSSERYLAEKMQRFKPFWGLFRAFRFYYAQNSGRGRPALISSNMEEAKTKLEANKHNICGKAAEIISDQLGIDQSIHITIERKNNGWDDVTKTNSFETIHRQIILLLGADFADIVYPLIKGMQRRRLMYEAKRAVTKYVKKKWRLHDAWRTRKKFIGYKQNGNLTTMNYKMIAERYLYQRSCLKQFEIECFV
jgi:hypothetical protein